MLVKDITDKFYYTFLFTLIDLWFYNIILNNIFLSIINKDFIYKYKLYIFFFLITNIAHIILWKFIIKLIFYFIFLV